MHYKRLFYAMSAAFVVTLVFAVFVAVYHAYADRPITVYVDGKKVDFPDAQPQMIDGRIFVPIRFVSEALGATVERDAKTNSVYITSPKQNEPEPEIIQAEVGEVIEFTNSKIKMNELTYYTNSSGTRFANLNFDVYINSSPTYKSAWTAINFVDAYILNNGQEIRGSKTTKDEIKIGKWNNVNVTLLRVESADVTGVIVIDPTTNEKARVDF